MKENNNLSLSDLNDSTILRENESLLSLLLKDHTTGKNIKWGTDSYINHGYSFRDDQEIKINLITGWYEGFIQPRVDKDIDIQLERQRNRAEVFTPSWVIKLQVDAALKDMEELSLVDFIQTKWLEITCGEAPYMVNRYDMETGDVIPLNKRSGFIDVKFKRLNKEIEIEDEWVELALEIYKASYGYEYQGDSLLLARENLILTFIDNYFYMFGAFPDDKLLLEITRIVSFNVFQMDGLTYEIPYTDGGFQEYGTQLNLFEEVKIEERSKPKLAKIKLWSQDKTIQFKTLSERNDAGMKFDVVLGNPPYQGNANGGNKNYSSPIYHHFIEESQKIGKKVILIHPARFLFNAGGTPKKWNKKMLNSNHLKILDYISNSSEVFINTDIKGGVAISYWDVNKNFEAIEFFTSHNELREIVKKVREIDFIPMSKIVSARGVYKFSKVFAKEINSKTLRNQNIGTNAFDLYPHYFSDDQKHTNTTKIIGRLNNKRINQYILNKYIVFPNDHEKYKVILPKANGTGDFGETLSQPMIVRPKEGFTETFISIGNLNTEFEAKSLVKYIHTKFLRAMLGVLKVTQDNTRIKWEFVPFQDFTEDSDIDWSKSIYEIDKQLYSKYNLNEEEIEFIETNVKEME